MCPIQDNRGLNARRGRVVPGSFGGIERRAVDDLRRDAGKAVERRRTPSHNGLSKLSQSIAMTEKRSFTRSETYKEQRSSQLERRPATILRVFSRLMVV